MNKRMTTTALRCRSGLCCILAGMMLASLPAAAQMKGEYFWNNDPGVGRASKLIESGQSDGYGIYNLDASGLTGGVNLLGLRPFSRGHWGQTQMHFVMVDVEATEQWSGEYFWNEDPGVGKATKFPLSRPQGGIISLDIEASGLPVGTNVLGLRVNSGGSWSQTQTYIVAVPASPVAADWKMEYFWDSDPGPGKATSLKISPDGVGMVSIDLLTGDLEPGEHTLGLRTNSGGTWSQTLLSTIVVPHDYDAKITAAEYFWGDDPGFGKGTPVEITPGKDVVSVDNLTLDFPSETAAEYVLSFRARSVYGWGQTVTKVIPHLYVQSIALTADKDWIEPGETMALNAEITPADAFIGEVTWSSSDPAVATVDTKGSVKGVSCGTAVITATSTDGSDVSATKTIRVLNPVKSLTLSATDLTIEVSRTAQLSATAKPANATDATVQWSVTKGTDIVKIDQTGKITALKQGSATVSATAADGCGATADCAITVVGLKGDADGNGSLAVNDVVLTARAVIDDIDSKFDFEAADMNQDGSMTVGDLTRVADAVIAYQAQPKSIIRRARELGSSPQPALTAGEMTVKVQIPDLTWFFGVQFDLILPDGMELDAVLPADAEHTVMTRRLNGVTRVMSYSTEPYYAIDNLFATLRLTADPTLAAGEYDLKIINAMTSDFEGNLFCLENSAIRVAYSPESGLAAPETSRLTIRAEGHKVIIDSPADMVVVMTDMRGISRRIELHNGRNGFTIETTGVYIIDGQKIIIR